MFYIPGEQTRTEVMKVEDKLKQSAFELSCELKFSLFVFFSLFVLNLTSGSKNYGKRTWEIFKTPTKGPNFVSQLN
jgi:hypothetical protein